MHKLSKKDEQRYSELFKKLDVNSDGKIDVKDLVKLFEQNQIQNCQESHQMRAEVVFSPSSFFYW